MVTRRVLLGAAGAAAASGPVSWLRLSAAGPEKPQRRCVLIWLDGGPSQLDTLDPKPLAPNGHGGPLRPISTSVAGIQLSETLPQIAKLMDRSAVIRSMSTPERTHGRGRFHLHTGYLFATTLDFPSIGAVVSHLRFDGLSNAPRYVHLGGGGSHGCSSGFLGARHSPLKVKDDIPFLRPRLRPSPYNRRVNLLKEIEREHPRSDESLYRDHRDALDATLDFMHSSFPDAFDVSNEPDTVRDRYGKGDVGTACLQARRVLEAGVPFVEVNSTHWDMHAAIYSTTSGGIRQKSTVLDQAVSALVSDLDQRGLLDETLIVWMGEFGRTPSLGTSSRPGRDHYSTAWSTLLIGGGIPGGQVVGSTDKSGAEVIDRPVSAADFLATIYEILGVDHSQAIIGPGNRPLHLVDRQADPAPIASLI